MSDTGSMSNDSVSSSMSTSMSSSSGADSRGDQHSDAPAQTTASTAADHDHDFHYYVTSPREPSGDDTTADTAATGSPIGDGGQTGVTHPADGEKPAGYSTGVQDHGAVASVPTQHDKDVATWMEQEAQIAKALAQQAELEKMPAIGATHADTLKTLDDAAHSAAAAYVGNVARNLGADEHDVQHYSKGSAGVSDLASSVAMTKGSGGASLPGQESPQQMVDKAQSATGR
ncbi:hypothetical protein [Dactylosporangium sp. NPDC006015]|uniref:hypothetical protein n=1 Tax=Dactylosporangium sp. NPDC006015 TaxID=3154576 RepID=UPI0033AABE29